MQIFPVLSKLKQIHQCHSIFINLTSYVHSQNYEKDSHFEDDVLLVLTPYDIYGWISKKVYHIPIPTEDNNPTKGKVSALTYYKKVISHFS